MNIKLLNTTNKKLTETFIYYYVVGLKKLLLLRSLDYNPIRIATASTFSSIWEPYLAANAKNVNPGVFDRILRLRLYFGLFTVSYDRQSHNFRDGHRKPRPDREATGPASSGKRAVGDAKLGDAKIGDAKIGDAKIGDAKIGDAKIGDAKIEEFEEI
ncbi:unnamed protein product [Agarophyton chilense]